MLAPEKLQDAGCCEADDVLQCILTNYMATYEITHF